MQNSNTKKKLENIKKPQNNKPESKPESKPENAKTQIMKPAISAFAFMSRARNILSLFLGICFLIAGIYILSYDDISVENIKGNVKSVKYDNDDGCKLETKKNQSYQNTWLCNVIATYKTEEEEEVEYQFENVGEKISKNEKINLYRFKDGDVSHKDPNEWKNIGWILFGIGIIITAFSSFWLYICTRKNSGYQVLCAAREATEMFSNALGTKQYF